MFCRDIVCRLLIILVVATGALGHRLLLYPLLLVLYSIVKWSVCVYVCICLCVCVCLCMCVSVCMYVCVCVYVCVCLCVCMCVFLCVSVCVSMCFCVYVCICVCLSVCVCIYICVWCVCLSLCVYAYMHLCVCVSVCVFCVCMNVNIILLQMSKSCSTLVVYWTKPHDNGSPVTAYHIELNGKRSATVTGALTEATLTDLSPQTDYKYVWTSVW